MSQYTYQPLPDSKSCIRLLTIESVGHTISCTLDDFPIANPPLFHAVSYCWGTEPESERVYIGHEWIPVTGHLLEGIRSLHKLASPPKLWIDAICINQVDDSEKEGQIPLMRKIYGNAQKVLVWLGTGAEGSDLAMESIPSLCEKFASVHVDAESEELWQEAGIPPKRHQFWAGFAHIFTSPWFGRLWPVQEVVLAKEVVFFSGDSSTKMAQLSRIADSVHIDFFPHQFSTHQLELGLYGVISLMALRVDASSSKNVQSAFTLLEFSRGRSATEHVDYVYAIFGMLDESICCHISVNYSEQARKEYWRMFASLAASLLLLSHEAVFELAATKVRDPNLPSWCYSNVGATTIGPNWASVKLGRDFRRDYRAGLGALTTTPSASVIMHNQRVFGCRGLSVDRIRNTVSFLLVDTKDEECLALIQQCEHLVQSLNPNKWSPENLTLQVARTLVADNTFTEGRRQVKYPKTLCDEYMLFKDDMSRMAPGQTRLWPSASVFRDSGKKNMRYYVMFKWTSKNSCFFITEQGFVGMGPHDSQVGDEVCVLFGVNTPYVIRERLELQYYQLVGQAYVDGIMDGELVDGRDPTNDREFLFT